MSKYIDASLVVEMQVYDDEYEEWSIWNVTIEDLLNRWTEEGCPPAIEVNEDCISRANLIESFLADNECKREEVKACMCSLDLMLELIEDAPSVTPTERTGEWIPVKKIYRTNDVDFPNTYIEWETATEPDDIDAVRCSKCGEVFDFEDARNWCTECGAKMKGGTENE